MGEAFCDSEIGVKIIKKRVINIFIKVTFDC